MKGYMTIVTVLVLLAVTGSIAATLTFVSIDATQSAEALRQGDQALLFSESCLEEVLLQIARDPAYSGKNFAMPQGSCEVTVAESGGTYDIHVVGKNDKFERGVAATAILDLAGVKISNWKEE